MTAPRIEVDLGKIRHNTRSLVRRLKPRGIKVTSVTKAVCGHPDIAQAMLDGGATGLADARLVNIKRLRSTGITCPISMIRTPMLSEADQVTQSCETSYNTEIDVIACLAAAARSTRRVHNIILMVEMGDMREGIMPEDLEAIALKVSKMRGVALKGIGANFACFSGKMPVAATMTAFSALVSGIERACGSSVETVSGGNSANLPWALGGDRETRINDLRLGEAILLGVDPISGNQIGGLYTDAFTLIAEVIETKNKPESLHLSAAEPSLKTIRLVPDENGRSILAIGQQDTDIAGLTLPFGATFVGTTSDHLVIRTDRSRLPVGYELELKPNYSALMRAMNAPDIAKVLHNETHLQTAARSARSGPHLESV